MENLSDCLQARKRRVIEATMKAYRMELAIAGRLWHNFTEKLLEGYPMNDFPGFHQGGWILCCVLSLTAVQDTHHLYNAWNFLAQARY
jgi:hypothetical protein